MTRLKFYIQHMKEEGGGLKKTNNIVMVYSGLDKTHEKGVGIMLNKKV